VIKRKLSGKEEEMSALRDGCLCTCLLKHDQGQEPSQPYDRIPQNSKYASSRKGNLGGNFSQPYLLAVQALRAVAAGCYPWQVHVFE